jgi:serine/threonine protein kinase
MKTSSIDNDHSDASSSDMNDNKDNTAAAAESPTSLIKSPPSSPSTTTTSAAAAEHERQTLLLMLLAQVCSLHDATPRTFVVHVLALFERGILDSNSIRFLFDMGLVPWRYNEQFTGCFDDNSNGSAAGNNKRDNDDGECDNNCYKSEIATPQNNTATPAVSAIVPYAANNLNNSKHPWMRHIPPAPPLHHNSQQSKMNMSIRQSQASAIRRHLAHQESIDSSSAHSSVFGSASAGIIPGITSASTTTTSSTANHNGAWKRTTSSATAMPSKHSSLLSVDESFYNPSQHKNNNSSDNRTTNVDNDEEEEHQQESHPHDQQHNHLNNTQLATTNVPINTSSWSAEHHPLSLSRYQREFHQLSLLATGSFGSVYQAIHKLEHKPYAVKRVTFSTTGYYANTLALVIREVRCLAQLDHPNCVRYYTSWLEPSWMTGGVDDDNDNDHQSDEEEEHDGIQARPKLLPHIERVVNEINSTGEILHSVQQLESILYGKSSSSNNTNTDDGFEWDTVSSTHHHNDLPSHSTNIKQMSSSVYSYGSEVDDGDDSDFSEWSQDMMNSKSSSFGFERQGSLEIVPAGQDQHHKSGGTEGASSPYKYQICLFIQMQLCHPTTLADWIKRRNHDCEQFGADERQARARPAFEAFRQIVNGLAHIHSKGIIHRDLKPANIFASSDDGTWMIGDFGLSKMMRDAQQGGGVDHLDHSQTMTTAIILPNGKHSNGQHTAGVGTASYAAPEQITHKNYGPAVDIFSLGLILLELFSNFTSEHERAVAFHDCRYHGKLAPWMRRIYPEVSSLVQACTQKDWTQRPTASEILSASVFQEGLSGVEIYRAELKALSGELARKDDVIQCQNDVIQSQNVELAEKDELIQQLRLQLENAGISDAVVNNEDAYSEDSKTDY